MKNNPSFFIGERRPVEMVSWEDAQVFSQKLNKLTGKAYRLPTEAEWEYAACGGRKNRGCTFAGSSKLREVGWYEGNSHGETKAVGMKNPNELGIYDMSGNIWEWCQDWFDEAFYEKCASVGVSENPQGVTEGDSRLLRGGSWYSSLQFCRCSCRSKKGPNDRSQDTGFRLVLPLHFTL